MKGKMIFVTNNPLPRQYLKQQATDKVYRLYAKTHERCGKAEEEKRIKKNGNINYSHLRLLGATS